jgi:alpha-tubulin suppressor-like RCC1 family protein
VVVTTVLAVAGTGCQDTLDPPSGGPVASVIVAPEHATVVAGTTVQFTASLKDEQGTSLGNRAIVWASSNPAVATIDQGGRARVLSPGQTTITATSEGQEGSATITEGQPIVFTSLSLGTLHTCGLTAAGAAYCWGTNGEGQLGNGSTESSNVPVPVSGGIAFKSLSARGVHHTCGLDGGGRAYCWGRNIEGFLGDGTLVSSTTPVPVAGGLTFTRLVIERTHSCATTATGEGYCWGMNSHGELGDGTLTPRNVPTRVAGGHVFASIQPGRNHTCGLTPAGAVFCWGDNEHGQLGDGTTVARVVPVAAATGMAFTSLTVRDRHACGIAAGPGGGYCWGYNIDGQLGDGTVIDRFGPVAVTRGSTLFLVDAGSYHSCGVATGGSAWCWGENVDGPLGDGTKSNSSVPVAAGADRLFVLVSAGCFHTCGITPAGETFCWGRNLEGQLGNGDNEESTTAVRVFRSP